MKDLHKADTKRGGRSHSFYHKDTTNVTAEYAKSFVRYFGLNSPEAFEKFEELNDFVLESTKNDNMFYSLAR